MTKTIVSIVLIIFIVAVNLPGVRADTTEEMYKRMTEILHRFDPAIDYNGLHQAYRDHHPAAPIRNRPVMLMRSKQNRLLHRRDITAITSVLVLVQENLYHQAILREKIDRYITDIHRGYGCTVFLEAVAGGTAEGLKNLIVEYSRKGIDGVVMIGRFPAAWFEISNDHADYQDGYGYADWTCDLFFMDLDGRWIDTDNNGKYDTHSNGNGDIYPEIFIGRIDPLSMGTYGDEAALLLDYLDKNHAYWTGSIPLPHYGLAYIDKDWVPDGANYFRPLYGMDSYEGLVWRETNNHVYKGDYCDNRLNAAVYGFTQVWVHSTYLLHAFHTGGHLNQDEIHRIAPRSVGYNINGCHAADWGAGQDDHFLSGSYIYNGSPSSLVVVSTTKSGGMLEFSSFYRSLGENNCMGRALVDWFPDVLQAPGVNRIISWHYGMVIIGDPMVSFIEVPGWGPNEPAVYPPAWVSVTSVENRSLAFRQIIHQLNWMENTQNRDSSVAAYRIYQIKDQQYTIIGETGPGENTFWFRGGDGYQTRYAVSAIDSSGNESPYMFATGTR